MTFWGIHSLGIAATGQRLSISASAQEASGALLKSGWSV